MKTLLRLRLQEEEEEEEEEEGSNLRKKEISEVRRKKNKMSSIT